jgi:hypothetical protein
LRDCGKNSSSFGKTTPDKKMKIYQTIVAGASSALFFGSSMNYVAGQVEAPVQAVTESVPYTGTNGDDLLGHLSVPSGDGPFPAIVIVPDWGEYNIHGSCL